MVADSVVQPATMSPQPPSCVIVMDPFANVRRLTKSTAFTATLPFGCNTTVVAAMKCVLGPAIWGLVMIARSSTPFRSISRAGTSIKIAA